VTLNIDKLFENKKSVRLVYHPGVIILRDDRYKTVVKKNNGGGWSSDGVLLWV
jgi:hypothetical protein